jgi:hypothetical protein
MLLKSKSKPQRKGFKRKRLGVLGSFQEIKDGAKKVDSTFGAFASNPFLTSRQ